MKLGSGASNAQCRQRRCATDQRAAALIGMFSPNSRPISRQHRRKTSGSFTGQSTGWASSSALPRAAKVRQRGQILSPLAIALVIGRPRIQLQCCVWNDGGDDAASIHHDVRSFDPVAALWLRRREQAVRPVGQRTGAPSRRDDAALGRQRHVAIEGPTARRGSRRIPMVLALLSATLFL
jgi:hypothetical protein